MSNKRLLLIALVGLLSLLFLVYTHEQAHIKIYSYFGCANIEHTMFKTYCTDRPSGQSESEALAHSINESIGYHMAVIILLLAITPIWKR